MLRHDGAGPANASNPQRISGRRAWFGLRVWKIPVLHSVGSAAIAPNLAVMIPERSKLPTFR